MRVNPKNTTQCPQPGFEPGPRDPEMSALTMKPKRLRKLERVPKGLTVGVKRATKLAVE